MNNNGVIKRKLGILGMKYAQYRTVRSLDYKRGIVISNLSALLAIFLNRLRRFGTFNSLRKIKT